MASNGPPPLPPSSSFSSARLNPPTHAQPHLRTPSPAGGTATPQLTTGSATQTITSTPTGTGSPLRGSASPDRECAGPPHLVLRLRGAAAARTARTEVEEERTGSMQEEGGRRGIRWAEDVVDNEGLGRKSSKVCCIYHKPRAVGESSSEEDSSSDSDSDSGSEGGGSDSLDDGGARMAGVGRGGKGKGKGRAHGNEHGEDCGHGHGHGDGEGAKRKRKPSPNAYEKMPSYGKKS